MWWQAHISALFSPIRKEQARENSLFIALCKVQLAKSTICSSWFMKIETPSNLWGNQSWLWVSELAEQFTFFVLFCFQENTRSYSRIVEALKPSESSKGDFPSSTLSSFLGLWSPPNISLGSFSKAGNTHHLVHHQRGGSRNLGFLTPISILVKWKQTDKRVWFRRNLTGAQSE